jgi:hypothetical protein
MRLKSTYRPKRFKDGGAVPLSVEINSPASHIAANHATSAMMPALEKAVSMMLIIPMMQAKPFNIRLMLYAILSASRKSDKPHQHHHFHKIALNGYCTGAIWVSARTSPNTLINWLKIQTSHIRR